MAGTIRIGLSGWTYAGWRGRFYPRGLPQSRELAYASGQVGSIEVNGSFYSLQRPESYARWAAATPADFVFAIKGSRYVTHFKRLSDPTALANFFASGLLRLGPKLGPILWQLPARTGFDPERLDAFLSALPRTGTAASALARRHDHRLDGRGWTEAPATLALRHALEVRHPGFATPEVPALLRRHHVALVVSDASQWPQFWDVTADFVYARLHGPGALYASGYDAAEIDRWAKRVTRWSEGGTPDDTPLLGPPPPKVRRDVFVYFDNDAKVDAPKDADALQRRLGAAVPASS